jgi:hypothetical protein
MRYGSVVVNLNTIVCLFVVDLLARNGSARQFCGASSGNHHLRGLEYTAHVTSS